MKRRILRTLTLRCFPEQDNQVIMFGDDSGAPTVVLSPELVTLFDAIDGQRVDAELASAVISKHPHVSDADVFEALSDLERLGVFEDADAVPADTGSTARYDRQKLYFDLYDPRIGFADTCQRKIEASRLLLIGCGGVGSSTLLYLANAGVGQITVVDFDTVEVSNLSRSFLFADPDLGRSKMSSVAAKPWPESVTVNTIELEVASLETMREVVESSRCDFAVLAADKPYGKINEWFSTVCIEHRIPNSSAGCSQRSAAVGPITIPGQTACFVCQEYEGTDLETGPAFVARVNRGRVAAAFGPVIGAIAGLHSHEILMYLSTARRSILCDHQIVLDFETLEMTHVPQRRRDDCPACGSVA